jgi:molybdenum cofactor synthesis domain-containing protein
MLKDAGWEIVGYTMLPDDFGMLAGKISEICDSGVTDLLVTTGGTGFSPRDNTPEVTLRVCERPVPGIPEAMRYASLAITPRAMLSRAAAGIRNRSLIVNLPGSPKAAKENLEAVLPALDHGLLMLRGGRQDCAKN